MASPAIASIVDYLVQSRDAVQAAIDNAAFLATAEAIVDRLVEAIAAGRKVLFAGNGGSAGDAQHLAGEFLSRLNYDRAPLPAIALTTDSSVLTAIGNDYGYDRVFERRVLGLGVAGDVLIAISTSVARRTFCPRSRRRGPQVWSSSALPAGAGARWPRVAISAFMHPRTRRR